MYSASWEMCWLEIRENLWHLQLLSLLLLAHSVAFEAFWLEICSA